ncbi:MAG TPA: hypothetical protein VEC16_04475 [Alphaproteobacteria bacterium]|nr:hypothetical protein [Alphaproteobacteria bacterium]
MIEILREGINISIRNISVKIHGLKKYPGNDEEICRQIIDSCYNKKMAGKNSSGCFNASSGNYKVFYSRDFGWCVESLLNLGYEKQVKETLRYVLEKYEDNKEITVAINAGGKCFNFPDIYSPDSVAYLFRSLRIAKSKDLIMKYKEFLNSQIHVFEQEVLDLGNKNNQGIIRDKNFSGMRDHNKNNRSCYDMIMACMLSDEVVKINKLMGKKILDEKLSKYDLKKKLVKYYWTKTRNGAYFKDSLTENYCSGHANVYPYFLDIITDKKMLESSVDSIIKNKLDKPIPLKYGYGNNTKFLWYNIFAPDWEKNTSWAMLGLAYISVVSRLDRDMAKKYLKHYQDKIIEYKSFIELYDEGKPYKSLFFTSDESMLWASMYLDLKKKLRIKKN